MSSWLQGVKHSTCVGARCRWVVLFSSSPMVFSNADLKLAVVRRISYVQFALNASLFSKKEEFSKRRD